MLKVVYGKMVLTFSFNDSLYVAAILKAYLYNSDLEFRYACQPS